jgi:hypothetical protein
LRGFIEYSSPGPDVIRQGAKYRQVTLAAEEYNVSPGIGREHAKIFVLVRSHGAHEAFLSAGALAKCDVVVGGQKIGTD